MAACEMCGKVTDLYEVIVEGTTLKTCQACAACGTILKGPQVAVKPLKNAGKLSANVTIKHVAAHEVVVVSDDVASLLRKEREKRKLTQDDFAKLLVGKASMVHKIESGSLRPDLETAKKWEKILGVKLTEKSEDNTMDL